MADEGQSIPSQSEPPPPLSQEDRQKVAAWLREKAIGGEDHPCPVCGHTEWDVGENLLYGPVLSTRGVALNRGYPLVAVICTTCGHVLLFHAKVIDIAPGPSPLTRLARQAWSGTGHAN